MKTVAVIRNTGNSGITINGVLFPANGSTLMYRNLRLFERFDDFHLLIQNIMTINQDGTISPGVLRCNGPSGDSVGLRRALEYLHLVRTDACKVSKDPDLKSENWQQMAADEIRQGLKQQMKEFNFGAAGVTEDRRQTLLIMNEMIVALVQGDIATVRQAALAVTPNQSGLNFISAARANSIIAICDCILGGLQ